MDNLMFLIINFGIAFLLFLPLFFIFKKHLKKHKMDYEIQTDRWQGTIRFDGKIYKIEKGDQVYISIKKRPKETNSYIDETKDPFGKIGI